MLAAIVSIIIHFSLSKKVVIPVRSGIPEMLCNVTLFAKYPWFPAGMNNLTTSTSRKKNI